MTVATFLQSRHLSDNPFRGEEARSDDVFARMERAGEAPGPGAHAIHHPDFDKIVGDLSRPSSAVVFGEKGSGKTAIRLQLEQRVGAHNAAHPAARALLVPYDDLNAVLDRVHERAGGGNPLETAKSMRLVDHIDAVLHSIVPRLTDALLGHRPDPALDVGEEPWRALRRAEPALRRDALVLQAVYDRPQHAPLRTRLLRRRLRVRADRSRLAIALIAALAPAVIGAGAWAFHRHAPDAWRGPGAFYALGAAIAAYAGLLLWILALRPLAFRRPGRRLRRQVRVIARSHSSYAASLLALPRACREGSVLPLTDSDEARYAMLDRLKRILRAMGIASLVLVVDRVDEPTLVSGDPDRMRAVVWPMLNNKFLQQEGLGVKLLLPIELRHSLFRESSAFFQEARLDKQNLVERLEWTGPMLLALCDARLAACTLPGMNPVSTLELFEDSVTRQEVVDALDRMRQPRDAFKLMYRVIAEHGATASDRSARIPGHVLAGVLRQETDRVQQLHRGIRPA